MALDADATGTTVVRWWMYGARLPSAFIWDPVRGAQHLDEVLSSFGLGAKLANWQLDEARSISADGRTIAA
jgi:hypothetical protein